jgi:hypothetical protein
MMKQDYYIQGQVTVRLEDDSQVWDLLTQDGRRGIGNRQSHIHGLPENGQSYNRMEDSRLLDATTGMVRRRNVPDLIGYQEIKCHIIVFDVKMDIQRMARFVAGGHTTTAPSSIT